jgi:hypothetical protein
MLGITTGISPPKRATIYRPSFLVTEIQHVVQKFRSGLRPTPDFAGTVSNLDIRGLPMRAQQYNNQNQDKAPPVTKKE